MEKKYLTKQQAAAMYKEHFADVLASKDKGAIRFTWNTFTDGLHRDGQISDKQAQNWLNPFDK